MGPTAVEAWRLAMDRMERGGTDGPRAWELARAYVGAPEECAQWFLDTVNVYLARGKDYRQGTREFLAARMMLHDKTITVEEVANVILKHEGATGLKTLLMTVRVYCELGFPQGWNADGLVQLLSDETDRLDMHLPKADCDRQLENTFMATDELVD